MLHGLSDGSHGCCQLVCFIVILHGLLLHQGHLRLVRLSKLPLDLAHLELHMSPYAPDQGFRHDPVLHILLLEGGLNLVS